MEKMWPISNNFSIKESCQNLSIYSPYFLKARDICKISFCSTKQKGNL